MWDGGNNFGGAGAGAGGGGFMKGQGAGNFDSPKADKGGKEGRRSKNLVPATCRQLRECQEDTFVLEGVEAHMLTIVGLVRSVTQTTTKVTIHIDDQTGTLECMQYVGTDENGTSEIPFIPVEGTYARIIGALRNAKGSRYLIIFRCLPVTDLNEMTCHMLEVVQVPMKLKKMKEAEAQKTGVGLDNTLANSMIAQNFGQPAGQIPGGPTGAAQQGQPKPGFKGPQSMVLSIIQNNQSDSGIHKDELIRTLRGKVTVKEIEEILENLSSEGHIFSTVDDDHYRSTD